ncbi:MAG: TonB-dependent receptor, partial [Gemmatimonadota bacterium]|nr:TonB-dependent receptor [Gemmatimonadota bacterium]
GGQFYRNLWHNTRSTGEGLIPGGESVSFGTTTSAGETTEETRTVGTYLEQAVSFGDRMFLAASLRGDDNSSLGKDFDFVLYPKMSASWEVSKEGFFPGWDAVDNVRLRAAWGRAGIQPRVTDALLTYDLFPVVVDGEPELGARVSTAGDPGLRPERSSELEMGTDLEMFGGRLGATVTYYRKRTEDALAFRALPPSLGVARSRRENIGVVSNRGWEFDLAVVPSSGEDVNLVFSANVSFNRNRIEEICATRENGSCDASPIRVGSFNWHRAGYEPGAFWDVPILGHNDLDGDGFVDRGEVLTGDTAVYFGPSQPTRLVNVTAQLTLFRRLTLAALVDHQGGHVQYNFTGVFKCLGYACRPAIDPATSNADQLSAVAARERIQSAFIEPAWFVRLRELSLSLRFPDAWADRMGAEGLSVTLAGRNLARFDDYRGLDPETNSQGQAAFDTLDLAGFPPNRYWTGKIGVTF